MPEAANTASAQSVPMAYVQDGRCLGQGGMPGTAEQNLIKWGTKGVANRNEKKKAVNCSPVRKGMARLVSGAELSKNILVTMLDACSMLSDRKSTHPMTIAKMA